MKDSKFFLDLYKKDLEVCFYVLYKNRPSSLTSGEGIREHIRGAYRTLYNENVCEPELHNLYLLFNRIVNKIKHAIYEFNRFNYRHSSDLYNLNSKLKEIQSELSKLPEERNDEEEVIYNTLNLSLNNLTIEINSKSHMLNEVYSIWKQILSSSDYKLFELYSKLTETINQITQKYE